MLTSVRRFLRARMPPRWGGDVRRARLAFIDSYRYPEGVIARFKEQWPALDADQVSQVFDALKSYFAICAADPGRPVGMPSRIVDEAWHTFILFTRDYTAFCERAFGRYLHHAPADGTGDEDPIRYAWQAACAYERLPAQHAIRLPLLFAVDRRLKIPQGRYYALNDTDADMTRRMMGATAIVYLAATLGGDAGWHDEIFEHARNDGSLTPFGGELTGGDIGPGDAGGSSGCSGGGN